MTDLPKVFLAHAERVGVDEDLALDRSVAIIGFGDAPSLERCTTWGEVNALVQATYPDAKKGARA